MSLFSHRTKVLLAFAAIYIIWGSTFLGVQVGLKSFPPFLFSTLRLFVAGAALSVFCLFRHEPFPSWADIKKNAFCGLVIFIGGIVAVVWAQQFILSSMASAIITTPFWFVVLDRQQWKYYFSNKWILGGFALGLAGVILLASFKTGHAGSASESMQWVAILVMVVGSSFWVSGSLYLKYNPSPTSAYVSTSIQLLSAGVFCFLICLASDELKTFSFALVKLEAILSVFYLALASSLVTFLAFIWLIKVRPPAIVSTYSYVNPLVATLLGWSVADEVISPAQLIALAIILLGVLLVNVPRYQTLKG